MTGGQIFVPYNPDSGNFYVVVQKSQCFIQHPKLAVRDTNALQSRDDEWHFCSPVGGQPWQPVDYMSVSRAIQAINNGDIGGNVGIGAGPAYCEVHVCIGDASIALCNDVSNLPSLPLNIRTSQAC